MDVIVPKERVRESLHNARVAFTGRLASMSRREAQALVREQGGVPTSTVSRRTTHLVIGMRGWPLKSDGSVSVLFERARALREQDAPILIISEARFLELTGVEEADPAVRKSYEIDQVSAIVGVPPATIERWEFLGLVRSDAGAYDFQDIVSLQTIASLVNAGVEPRHVRDSLDLLSSFVPDTDRPLAQLQVVMSDGGEVLAQVGDTLIAPDGQQLLNFGARPTAGDAGDDASAPDVHAAPAEDLFDRALELEEDERFEEAADAYRVVIARAPDRPETYFNLGNVLRMQGRGEAAAELYKLAVAVDPANELAWYNLADVLEEDGEFEDAVGCLRHAVSLDPSFADAFFNLAVCLEEIDECAEAKVCWQRYIELDPQSSWADVARRHLA